MRTRTRIFLFLLAMMPLMSFAQGTNSGGGEGDHAFAFQEIISKHPEGLTPYQILTEAYNQSQGRLPTIRQISDTSADFLPVYRENYTLLFNYAVNSGGLWSVKPTTEVRNIGFSLFRAPKPNDGPLIPTQDGNWKVNGLGPFMGYTFDLYTATTGLVAQYPSQGAGAGAGIGFEFRQYSPQIVVYTIKPFMYQGKKGCFTMAEDSKYVTEPPNQDDLCGIGYFWGTAPAAAK